MRSLCAMTMLVLLCACVPGMSTREPDMTLHNLQEKVVYSGDFPLSYVEAGSPGKLLVVFIHGTPGSWRAFEHFMTDRALQQRLHLIAVDRLGFGNSAGSGVQPDFRVQADAIAELFNLNRSDRPALLVGHSLGGSIAAYIASHHAHQVGGLFILSSALDPERASLRWYNYVASTWGVRWLIPGSLRFANEEMKVLQQTLLELKPRLRHIRIPVSVFQGDKDRLVDYQHALFAAQAMTEAGLNLRRFPEHGHFIIWQEPDLVTAEILRLVEAMEPSAHAEVETSDN